LQISFHHHTDDFTSHLASNEQAWQATHDLLAMMQVGFPVDEMLWGTAATKNVTSWLHIDDYGLGKIVMNIARKKYYIIGRPKHDQIEDQYCNAHGDLSSRNAFPSGWDASLPGVGFWDFEGVLLEPGDTL
jgi:hypothetical protein